LAHKYHSIKRLIKRSPIAGTVRLIKKRWDQLTNLFATRQEKRHSLSGPQGHRKVWKLKRDYQIWFLKEMGLQPDHYLLDIGCGTLRGGVPMIDLLHKGHYYGIDARELALDEARKELAECGLEYKAPILVLASDLLSVHFDQKFNFIWAFSVLPHMEDDILRDAFRFTKRHLDRDGQFLATVHVGASRQSGRWREFPSLVRPVEFYAREAATHSMTLQDLGPLSSLGHPPNAVNSHHHMLSFRNA